MTNNTAVKAIARFAKLPPVEKRHRIGLWKIDNLIGYRLSSHRNDTYIYYLVNRLAVALFFIVAGLYILSYLLGAPLQPGITRAISLSHDKPVTDLAMNFPVVYGWLAYLICLPYGLVMFFANVSLAKTDLFEWNVKLLEVTKGRRFRLALQSLFVFFILLILPLIAFAFPLMAMKYSLLGEHASGAVCLLIFYFIVFSNVLGGILMTGLMVLQAILGIGPRFSRTTV